jgi:hypothetical protein
MKNLVVTSAVCLLLIAGSSAAKADMCPDFTGSYSGMETQSYFDINVPQGQPPIPKSFPPKSMKYKITQKGCGEITIEDVVTYSIGSVTHSEGKAVDQGYSFSSGNFSGDQLTLVLGSRNPDGESTGTPSVIFTTLRKNNSNKLILTRTYNVTSAFGSKFPTEGQLTFVFHEN